MRLHPSLLAFALAIPAVAQSTPSTLPDLAARLAAQNALFEEQYQSDLKLSPLRATAFGDLRYNAQLDDMSLAGSRLANAANQRFLDRLNAIPTAGFSEKDQLSHNIMARQLGNRIAEFALKEFEMPVNQMSGIHTELADLPLEVPLDSVQHYQDYIARLHQIPRAFDQTIEVLRAGVADHLMPVRFLLEKVPVQCDGIVAANPFLIPTTRYPASISPKEQKRLTAEINHAIQTEVLPAYSRFAAFIRTDYAPLGRTALAITSLPDGQKRYQFAINSRTTTHLSATEIHAIGLREITRIESEMTVLAKRAGFPDLASFRASLKDNPKYMPASSEQILDDYRRYLGQMQPKLPQLFTILPKASVTVEAIPAFQAAMATHYMAGTPDGRRAGRIVVATADFKDRSLVDDEATAYHEGIPGHHLQVSIQQELTGVPTFQLHSHFTAYIEGWALYSEQLGKEVGFYQDPVSDYGRLSSELFRAVRLVVDTGIHNEGWSRDQVVDFFRKSGSAPKPEIQSETDRYIAWPAQALAYKLGQLKILELREHARKELGSSFDLRRFHDQILDAGALPLDLLEARIDHWMITQKSTSATARPTALRSGVQ